MQIFEKNNKKAIIFRICIILLVPIIISLLFFNPFRTYETRCSIEMCQKINADGSINVSKIIPIDEPFVDQTKVEKYFINDILDTFFKVGFGYEKYNLEITDLSETDEPDIVSINLIVDFRNISYTIKYQDSIIIKDVKFKPDDKIKAKYLFDISNEFTEAAFTVDYKVAITRPFKDFLAKFVIVVFGWFAIIRLSRKTWQYIYYKNRD